MECQWKRMCSWEVTLSKQMHNLHLKGEDQVNATERQAKLPLSRIFLLSHTLSLPEEALTPCKALLTCEALLTLWGLALGQAGHAALGHLQPRSVRSKSVGRAKLPLGECIGSGCSALGTCAPRNFVMWKLCTQ
eukprot:1158773-Pelagomonas_calceolata.AAC.19